MVSAGLSFNGSLVQAADVTVAKQLEQSFTSVAKEAIPAVVWIKVKSAAKTTQNDAGDDFLRHFFGLPFESNNSQPAITGEASGFIISPDGYILTNSHVVHDMSEIVVVLNDGREFPAKVIGQDPNTDVALIKIDAQNLPYLKLGDSNKLQVGQWAIAIGNPFGLQASLTVGVISATGRNNLSLAPVENYIQTDAAINRGHSGGPLLNLDGQVIGINTAIVSDGDSGGYIGIGFAIPSNIAKYDMEQIKEHGTVARGYIGVLLQQMEPDLAKAFGLSKAEGAVVTEVTKNSPAEKAGIKQGDVVIKYNDQLVSNVGALRNAVSMTAPGTNVDLTVLRGKQTLQIPLTIGTFPSTQELAVATPSPPAQKENPLGIEVQSLTPEIAESLGDKNQKGMLISKVLPGSIGSWAGLKKGGIIIEINHQPVNTVDQFNTALQNAEKGKPILLLIKQGESIRYLAVKIG